MKTGTFSAPEMKTKQKLESFLLYIKKKTKNKKKVNKKNKKSNY